MTAVAPLVINSIGPPPKMYADRVVAEMVRSYARDQAELRLALKESCEAARSCLRCPRQFRRLNVRVGLGQSEEMAA
jgi:hypothetical protein